MKVIFYTKSQGRSPVYDFLKKLQPEDRLRILACLKNIEELGFYSPRVQFRQIKGKLWEVKIQTVNAGYRIFYVTISSNDMVLLHAYQKQSQKAPIKEIAIAEKRMAEVLANETLFNT
jgi:phage-related protein